jgi:hypothetical protein
MNYRKTLKRSIPNMGSVMLKSFHTWVYCQSGKSLEKSQMNFDTRFLYVFWNNEDSEYNVKCLICYEVQNLLFVCVHTWENRAKR